MKRLLSLFGLIIVGCVAAASAASPSPATVPSVTTTLESVSTGGDQGNFYSYAIAISAHGRYVVFSSDGTNLVADDTNNQTDAFVRDRQTGETTRVSVSSSGEQAAESPDPFGGSKAAGISSNGRFVLFRSDASNLVPNDTNGAEDIFVHDRQTGATKRVSVSSRGRQANGSSVFPVISADGRYVVFTSGASNLVSGDTNGTSDIFVRDTWTHRTQRVSISSVGRQANGFSEESGISTHGRYVVFTSGASNLVPGDTNHLADVFIHDRRTGTTRRMSVSSQEKQGSRSPTNTGANGPSISGDGRYVAFHSDDSNLVPGDTNHAFDMFVRDRVAGKTRRVSVSTNGEQADAESLGPAIISADGRYVAFASLATNLVGNDDNDATDVFIRDRVAHLTILASLGADGAHGNDSSWPAAMSADDRYLAFSSWAGNLVPNDMSPGPDVFVRDFGGLPAS
jgi:Tol biopolymer transport system component